MSNNVKHSKEYLIWSKYSISVGSPMVGGIVRLEQSLFYLTGKQEMQLCFLHCRLIPDSLFMSVD